MTYSPSLPPLPLLLQQEFSGSSPKRRRGAEEKDEGIGSPDILEEEKTDDLRREMVELRQQLDKERSVRMMLEEHLRQEEVGTETHQEPPYSGFAQRACLK